MRQKLNLKNESQTLDHDYLAFSDRKPKSRPKKVSIRELMNTRKVSDKPPPMILQ